MIIRKLRLCLADIEDFIYCCVRSIVGDFENGGQTVTEYVGRNFEVIPKKTAEKALKKVLQFVGKLNVFRKYQGETSSLDLKLG